MAEETKQKTVGDPCDAYARLELSREKPRDLMQGIERVIERASVYAPRRPVEVPVTTPQGEVVDPWKNRTRNSRLRNFFADAVDDLVGRLFAKDPEVDEGTPAAIKELLDDVDLQGSSLSTFTKDRTVTAISEGIDFVLVGYTTPTDGEQPAVTDADRKRLGLRPFWSAYAPQNVIGWTTHMVGGVRKLATVRLRELVEVAASPWHTTTRERIRVLYAPGVPSPGSDGTGLDAQFARWEVYDKSADGKWLPLPTTGGSCRPQVEIPFVAFAVEESGFFDSPPPLLDLAYMNLAHYRKTMDLDVSQDAVGVVVLHWAGATEEEVKAQTALAHNRLFWNKDSGAKLGFVQPSGETWGAMEKTLAALEDQMRAAASEPTLTTNSGNLTATGEAIRSAKASSKLESWATVIDNSVAMLFYFTAVYLGAVAAGAETGYGGVRLNRKFLPLGKNVEGARLAHDRNALGKLSDETTFEVLQQAEIVRESLTWEEELERINTEGPPPPPKPSPFDKTPEDDEEEEDGDEKKDGEEPPVGEEKGEGEGSADGEAE